MVDRKLYEQEKKNGKKTRIADLDLDLQIGFLMSLYGEVVGTNAASALGVLSRYKSRYLYDSI